MWWRSRRLLWFALFVWVTVLGLFRPGVREWVLGPAIAVGCLLIAKEYLTKHYPTIAPAVYTALLALMVAYNLYFTVWPWASGYFPWTTRALQQAKAAGDFDGGLALDAGPLRAREALKKYLEQTDDAEAANIATELDQLAAKRRQGTFGEEDQKREDAVINRYKNLVRKREVLRRIIQGRGLEVSSETQEEPAGARSPQSPAQTARVEQELAALRQENNQLWKSVEALKREVQRSSESREKPVAETGKPATPETAEAPKPSPPLPPPPVRPVVNPIAVEEGDGFSFSVFACEKKARKVVCTLGVTNRGSMGRGTNLCGASYLVDNLGNSAANRRTTIEFGSTSSTKCGVMSLPINVLVRFYMSTDAFPEYAESVNIIIHDGNRFRFSFPGTIIFRNIPILQQR